MVRFVVYNPLSDPHRLAVVGGHVALGAWRRPRPMSLGPQRSVLTGGHGRCWEAVVRLAAPVDDLAYRYVVLADEPRWEREPNRHVTVPRPEETAHGVVEVCDHNVVTDLFLSRVTPGVWLGPYPQSPDDVDVLARAGITAVVNLQTDDELDHRDVDLDRLARRLQQRDIELHRMPIRDFDEADLIRKLPAACTLLPHLTDRGHRVYVHCTAGMGRAPAVVLAHLVRQGHDLSQAREQLRHHHPVSAPNVAAVRHALADLA